MIAIHNGKADFHVRWIDYCSRKEIPYKIVDCYSNNIIQELADCRALMWHIHQSKVEDILVAKQILFALEQTGFKVFPNFQTSWHFDDKVGQKYLFESIKAPFVPSFVFYNKEEALSWARNVSYPKVFKLRGGAGSQNVKLVHNERQAIGIINKAFRQGFSKFEARSSFYERLRRYKLGLSPLKDVLKGFIRLFWKPKYARVSGREFGYVYFQDFVPNNDSDTRIIVIGNKAFGLKRYNRKGDFRASGSGSFGWSKELFDERCVSIAFDLTKKLGLQVGAFDFIFDQNNFPLIVEVSFGFVSKVYDPCEGYWDESLNWYEGKTTKEDWMVDLIFNEINDTI